jgi:hypothetical protein
VRAWPREGRHSSSPGPRRPRLSRKDAENRTVDVTPRAEYRHSLDSLRAGVSDVVSRQWSWLRRCVRAGSARGVVIVVASSSFVLLAPASAGPALIHDRLPAINYTISGIRGTNGWYRGSRGGNYVVLRWKVRDPRADVIVTSGCQKEIIKGFTSGRSRTCIAASDNGINTVTTRLIKVDGDPPRFGAVLIRGTKRFVSVRWKASRDAHFIITRSPGKRDLSQSLVYKGVQRRFADRNVRSGVSYRYTLVAIDQAGNSAAKTIRATARATLLSPAPGVRLRSPQTVLFTWDAVPETSYYNIQLWTNGERILSAWPSLPRFRLIAPWTYMGVRRYLRMGRYTWYVWPGRGPQSLGEYGPVLGSSNFVVAR